MSDAADQGYSTLDDQAQHLLASATDGPQGYPFRALGYGDGVYYVLPAETLQIHVIPVAGMTSKSHLLSIAPVSWWETHFPAKSGAHWIAAADAVMRWCEAAGVFDPAIVRGRGAWFDDGRAVLHLGHDLIVDSKTEYIQGFPTRYVYERKPRLEITSDIEPLDRAESRRLREIMDLLHWDRPVSAILAAGWTYLAPICGALAWRPHLWVTGQKSSGKSWVLEQIIRPCLGASAVIVQANSTEAGIRQQMRQDARPILFDEAEAESRRDHTRIQSVIELARQASSENSAAIAKGTAGGTAQLYRVRSMFLLGSINVSLTQAADVSRFSLCGLQQPPQGPEGVRQFEALSAAVRETITPQWCERLRARAYRDIPALRTNAITLGKAVAEHLHDQRIGDQVGTLLAGAYGLKQDGTITLESARRMVGNLDWDAIGHDADEASDQRRLMDEILSAHIRYEGERTSYDRTVGELIRARTGEYVEGVDQRHADELLQRHGIRVVTRERTEVVIANTHPWLRRVLDGTPWAVRWAHVLGYADGAQRSQLARMAGQSVRGVSVPVEWVLGSREPGEDDEG
jgi:putative DNA primase/helicase